jgi:hypothetical protein
MRWEWDVNKFVVTEVRLEDGVEFGDSKQELGG